MCLFRGYCSLNLCFLALTGPVLAAPVDYAKLRDGLVRLEYGETFTIQGKTKDVNIAAGKDSAPEPLSKFLVPTSLKLIYQVSGLTPIEKTGEIQENGTLFTVSVDKLPENAKVGFRFVFSGSLAPGFITTRMEQFLTDSRYTKIVDDFFQQAEGRGAPAVTQQLREFVNALAPLLSRDLPDVIKISDTETLAQNLTKKLADAEAVAPLLRLSRRYRNAKSFLKITEDISADALRKKVDEDIAGLQKKTPGDQIPIALSNYVQAHDELKKLLLDNVIQIAATFVVSADAGVKDFEKYAGVDMGAIYIPRVQELRAFFTVNIYFGAVEDTPAPAAAPDARRRPTSRAVLGNALRQRLSLSFGMSLRDLSGRDPQKTKVEGNNAFVAGLGFRLNKYFRIVAGDALLRNKADNRIGHAFFIGPSIDVSAIQNLRVLFGKVKP